MIRFERHLHHIAVGALVVFLYIDAGDEFQAIEIGETLNAPRGAGLRCLVLGVDVACRIERATDKTAPHLAPGRPFLGVQTDVRPHLSLGERPAGDNELASEIHRTGVKRLGGVTTGPALVVVIKATGFERHAHRHHGALGDYIKAGLLRVGVVKVVPCWVGHDSCS